MDNQGTEVVLNHLHILIQLIKKLQREGAELSVTDQKIPNRHKPIWELQTRRGCKLKISKKQRRDCFVG